MEKRKTKNRFGQDSTDKRPKRSMEELGKTKRNVAILTLLVAVLAFFIVFVGIPVPVWRTADASGFTVGEEGITPVSVTVRGITWIRPGTGRQFQGTVAVSGLPEGEEAMTAQLMGTDLYLLTYSGQETGIGGIACTDSVTWAQFGIDLNQGSGVVFHEGADVITSPAIREEEKELRLRELRAAAGWPQDLLEQIEESSSDQ